MKSYFNRLLHGENSPKKWELVIWWIARSVLIATFVHALFFNKAEDSSKMALQVLGNLIGQFVWEILQISPKKSFLRHIPAYIQDISAPALIGGSLFGAYLNFYYSAPVLDIIMHAVGGVACTLIGYEIITAMEKRDVEQGDTYSSISIIVFGAFCFSFVAGNVWELFEFTADQLNPGNPGDAQHWSYDLAVQAVKESGGKIGLPNFIPHRDPVRYGVIDTMEDMICNTVGGFIGWILLKIRPYHHLERKAELKAKQKEAVTK
ncbi:MAG: hypothetical protein IJT65_05585 [Eubacterium sp.]|nr:hypothetical protein [Eubacterium sp.]